MQGGRVAEVAGPLGPRDDHARGVVRLHAAVEQVEGFADHAARQDVLDRDPFPVERLRVVRGVLAVGDLHGRHLLGCGAVVVHVAHERRCEVLPGALPAVGPCVQGAAADRGGGAGPGPADADLRVAVHRPEDGDRVAHARLDHADGDADERLGARPAAEHVHVEVQPDAEVAGHERGERRVVAGVGQHAVDVVGLEAGVVEGPVDRPGGEVPGRLLRSPPVGGLPDPDDGVAVAEVDGGRRVDVGAHAPCLHDRHRRDGARRWFPPSRVPDQPAPPRSGQAA